MKKRFGKLAHKLRMLERRMKYRALQENVETYRKTVAPRYSINVGDMKRALKKRNSYV